jgi:hypothetical protein
MATADSALYRSETMKRWCGYMEWLDRLGYITAGFSLLLLGMLIFAHAWYSFAVKSSHIGIILLELFRTVIRFLQTEVLSLEPYLAVGIIACTRRVLTAGAELSHQSNMTETQFYQYLMDVGMNVAVIMVLTLGVFLIRTRQGDKTAAAGVSS